MEMCNGKMSYKPTIKFSSVQLPPWGPNPAYGAFHGSGVVAGLIAAVLEVALEAVAINNCSPIEPVYRVTPEPHLVYSAGDLVD